MTVLGVVTGATIGKFDERIAWIWPLLDISNGHWSALADPQDEFPPRGYIFWPRAMQNAVKGALFQLRVKPIDVFKENGDQFMAVDARPALEVVDLRWIGDAERVRLALSQGIQLPGIPPQRSLLWCAGERVVGPVSLTTGANRETSLEKNDRARIQYFQLTEGEIRQFEYEGAVRYIIAKPSLGQADGHFDWDDDKPVIKRGLEYAVDRAKAMRGSLDFTWQMIDESVDELTKNGSIPDLRLKQYRLQRSLTLAGELKEVGELAEELIATLLRHPTVVKEVAQVKLQEREKAQGDKEAALASERTELAQLKETRTAAETGLQNVQKRLADSEASLEEHTRSMESRIQARISEVLNTAPALLADVALLKPFLNAERVHLKSGPATAILADTVVEPWKRAPKNINNAKELRARAIPVFKAMGLPTTSYQPIHAAIGARNKQGRVGAGVNLRNGNPLRGDPASTALCLSRCDKRVLARLPDADHTFI